MLHDWTFTDGICGTFMECSSCGLCYGLHEQRPTHGCKGTLHERGYVGNNNRQEPSEEILRQLGHGLFTTEEDV